MSLLLAATVVFGGGEAEAQRAGDNALAAAQDAFGTTIGNESIGLYSTTNVRGFSPVDAGNVRIEGLYIYQASLPGGLTGLDARLSGGSTIRVGLTAQGFPFPAPTGIVDYRLRLPGEEQVVSVVASYGPYGGYLAEMDTKVPLVRGKLGLVVGAGAGRESYATKTDNTMWSAGALLHWRPSDSVEITPFWNRVQKYDWETAPFISIAGNYLPPAPKYGGYVVPDWADTAGQDVSFGALGRLAFGSNWLLRAGIFRSTSFKPFREKPLILNVREDGSGILHVASDPPNQLNSTYSGEIRATGVFAEGPRIHRVQIAGRGYSVDRTSGGSDSKLLGPIGIDEVKVFPEPTFTHAPGGLRKTRQSTLGVAYEGAWPDVGNVGVGLQKAFYSRTIEQAGHPTTRSNNRPWLPYATLAVFVTPKVTVFSSYTRGLEESPIAPDIAANRQESLPATITEQVDAGIRYAITPTLRLVGGVFDLSKPYQDLDVANVYTTVGTIKRRGIELSLSGQFDNGLTMLAGAVVLQARVSGFTVEQGLISRTPAGSIPHILRFNTEYAPPAWHGFAVEAQIEHESERPANRLNTFEARARTLLNLGARYRFTTLGTPASLRIQAVNVTDVNSWSPVGSSGQFMFVGGRHIRARLSADF